MNLEKRYARSREMLPRVEQVIPLASQTFSKSHIQYPEASPHFLSHGTGAHVWDVDGNEYIDFICGLLPVILGHADPDVNRAVVQQMERGVSFSLPSTLEFELAELLVEIIPCAEMVRFGKNGSDATAGAVRVARAYTGRDRVAFCGYHGWQDWYVGATARNRGVPAAVRSLTHAFQYNDLSSLEGLFQEYPDGFAAVIMEPMNTDEPEPGFLKGVRDLAHKNGALFILDEIITGFRFSLGGAQELFGVIPDLATFGKSMANGFPISAVVGRREIMKEMEEIFFSFTFGGEAASLAAALATIRKLREEEVLSGLWEKGRRIRDGVTGLIHKHGLEDVLQIKGKPVWSLIMIQDHETADAWTLKSFFKQEMLRRGILISTSHNLCHAHSDADLESLFAAYDEVLASMSDALRSGDLERFLIGKPIEPLFKIR